MTITKKQMSEAADRAKLAPATMPISAGEMTALPPTRWERIGPREAIEYLATTLNRKWLSSATAKPLRDMQTGRFGVTHQGIAFDDLGRLIDGQHRLWAIVLSGLPQILQVTRGLSTAAQGVIDENVPRSLAARAKIVYGRELTPQDVGTAARMLAGFKKLSLTATELLLFIEKHRDAIDFAVSGLPGRSGVSRVPIKAAIARAVYHVDRDRLEKMVQILKALTVPADEGDQAAFLLLKVAGETRGPGSKNQQDMYAKAERAISSFAAHQPLAKLYAATEELFPLPEEQAVEAGQTA